VVHLIDSVSLLHLTIRPRFVGLAARPRAATRHAKHSASWRPLRSLSGDCGARAGGTGSAGYAGTVARTSNHFTSACSRAPSDKAGAENTRSRSKKISRTRNRPGYELLTVGLSAGRTRRGRTGASGAPYGS
jgi:hypothetical protein